MIDDHSHQPRSRTRRRFEVAYRVASSLGLAADESPRGHLMFRSFLFVALFSFMNLAFANPGSKEMASGEMANIQTFVSHRDGKPVTVGIRIPGSLLTSLPGNSSSVAVNLPSAVPPFDHVQLDWNPQGHMPDGIYNLPHFDVHFYTISREARADISCHGADLVNCEKRPEDRLIPKGYVPTPGGEPSMGAHWINPLSPEFNGERFTHTLIYGFYKGQMTFIEPMITTEFLLSHNDVAIPVAQPMGVVDPGFYPTLYTVRWLSVADVYEISLDGLVQRQ